MQFKLAKSAALIAALSLSMLAVTPGGTIAQEQTVQKERAVAASPDRPSRKRVFVAPTVLAELQPVPLATIFGVGF